MKTCVYGIALNQEDLCMDWVSHLGDADCVVVGDLGSTDGTRQILRDNGVIVYDLSIVPWRWDWPRNTLLSLLPNCDIAIALDINQKLSDGWRSAIMSNWIAGTDKIQSLFKPLSKPHTACSKIHSPRGYTWKNQILEELEHKTNEQTVKCYDICIHEMTEFKLGDSAVLFEKTINDYPTSGKMLWSYGYYNSCTANWEKATEYHKRNLEFGDSDMYRSESMIHLSGLIHGEREMWLTKATLEAPWRYEPWFELGNYYYHKSNYAQTMLHLMRALELENKEPLITDSYNNWQARAHDMIGLSAYNLGMNKIAHKHTKRACELNPDDKRLQDNLKAIENMSK